MIAIVKYNAGNTKSVQNAVHRLGFESVITSDKTVLECADKVIFPGVGQAESAMESLKSIGLDLTVKSLKQPVLGICLGLQLMCASSEEGNVKGLGIFDVPIVKFPPKDKVPHIGWNTLSNLKTPLFTGVSDDEDVYFVHSYYAPVCAWTIAVCDYIHPFSASLRKDNFYAVQFHPEKSGSVGEQILKNFLEL